MGMGQQGAARAVCAGHRSGRTPIGDAGCRGSRTPMVADIINCHSQMSDAAHRGLRIRLECRLPVAAANLNSVVDERIIGSEVRH
jgi:hypothetical protein